MYNWVHFKIFPLLKLKMIGENVTTSHLKLNL